MKKITLFFQSLFARTKEAFHRFPVSMVLIVLAFTLMMVNLWSNIYMPDQEIYRVIFILWVILPIFTAVTLFFKQRWGLLLGVLLGVALYFTTSNEMKQEDTQVLMMWGFAFYSLMFILPHWKRNQNNGFWNYCAQIFFVLVLGFVCSGILALSLTLAIESIRNLFMVSIDYRWTDTMALFSFFFVLPIFVHVGLPQDWEDLERSTDYPYFFKPISHYLLTPISILYFGILTAYVAKILITQVWPSGQVAYPILFLSALVFGSYLLSYPWRKEWNKWFFTALLPFMAIYFIALGMRVEQYGLTELRYLGLLLGACLTLMAFYFAFVKRQRLQMMLIPLALVAFVFAMGPWGASCLPIYSQETRLENLLIEVGALKDGKLVVVDASAVTSEQKLEISSIVEYLYYREHLDDLQAWTDVNLSPDDYGDQLNAFMGAMGLEYTPWYWGEGQDLYFDHSTLYTQTYYVAGYDAMADFDVNYDLNWAADPRTFTWSNGETVTFTMDEAGLLTLTSGTSTFTFDVMALHRQLDESGSYYELDPEELMLDAEDRSLKVRLYLNSINGSYTDDSEETVQNISAWGKVLVDFK